VRDREGAGDVDCAGAIDVANSRRIKRTRNIPAKLTYCLEREREKGVV